jgi:hypothetical protein
MTRERLHAGRSRGPLELALGGLILLWACDDGTNTVQGIPGLEEGTRFADSNIVLDAVNYSGDGCAEVLPAGFANVDSVPQGSVAVVTVISTACYAAHIEIVDTGGAAVRSLDRYFKIYGRQDGDKNRGMPGYLAWDGLDSADAPVAKGKYRWRIRFDFGGGRVFKYYGPVWLE